MLLQCLSTCTVCFLWDHRFNTSNISSPFTMRRPLYISLERPNQLRDIWDKLMISLLQLRIFPKIMPWDHIRIQPTSNIEGIFPSFFSTNQTSPRKGSTPPKGEPERYNTPPKKARKCQRSLTVYRGALPSKTHFWVVYSLSVDVSSSKLAFEVS